jgi:hypothetical protein
MRICLSALEVHTFAYEITGAPAATNILFDKEHQWILVRNNCHICLTPIPGTWALRLTLETIWSLEQCTIHR